MLPTVKTKMSIYQSKVYLDKKTLSGNITKLMYPDIRKMLEKGFDWEPRFHIPFIPFGFMIYLLLKLEFISESDNGIQSECRPQVAENGSVLARFSSTYKCIKI